MIDQDTLGASTPSNRGALLLTQTVRSTRWVVTFSGASHWERSVE